MPKYSAERRDSDFFLTKKMYCCSQKGTPLKSTSETRDSNNLLTNEHARDKAIDKRLEIPGFDSNGSSKGKTEKFVLMASPSKNQSRGMFRLGHVVQAKKGLKIILLKSWLRSYFLNYWLMCFLSMSRMLNSRMLVSNR